MRLYTPRTPEAREHTLPLVNIVFLLLIFFLLAGTLRMTDLFEITPPESISQTAPDAHSITISIAADGRLAAGGDELELRDLQSLITEQIDSASSLNIQLKADAATDTQRVIEVMELLQGVGVQKVWLLTRADKA